MLQPLLVTFASATSVNFTFDAPSGPYSIGGGVPVANAAVRSWFSSSITDNGNGTLTGTLNFDTPITGSAAITIYDTLPGVASSPVPYDPHAAIGVPTVWRGPNMGINAGVGANLDNSNPVLGSGSNDLQGDVTFSTDGNGASGTVYWTIYFSSPRGPVTVSITPIDDITLTYGTIFSLRTPDIHVLTDGSGNSVGFTFGTLETLNANVVGLHVKYAVTDTPAITIVKPEPLQNYQQWSGTSDSIPVQLSVSGTHDIEFQDFGGRWQIFALAATGTVNSTIPGQPIGFGPIRFRSKNTPGQMVSVYITVGENILSAFSQSNGVGEAPAQDYTPAPGDALPSLFGLDGHWKRLRDPTADNTSQVYTQPANGISYEGSSWLAGFSQLDAISTTFKARGRALCNAGQDSSVISDWQPGGDHFDTTTLFGQAPQRAADMGGISMLWGWLGEGNAVAGTSTATFKAAFITALTTFRAALNTIRAGMGTDLKIFLAKIMKITSGGVGQPAIDAINLGVQQLFDDGYIDGIFDFSAMTPSDGIVHVDSTAQAQACGAIIATEVKLRMGF